VRRRLILWFRRTQLLDADAAAHGAHELVLVHADAPDDAAAAAAVQAEQVADELARLQVPEPILFYVGLN